MTRSLLEMIEAAKIPPEKAAGTLHMVGQMVRIDDHKYALSRIMNKVVNVNPKSPDVLTAVHTLLPQFRRSNSPEVNSELIRLYGTVVENHPDAEEFKVRLQNLKERCFMLNPHMMQPQEYAALTQEEFIRRVRKGNGRSPY